ncbi:MAG: hypothetical protein EYC62_00735 [Alphaproteobacteria bacterium]|nr:MAG: hypothetical protein EYC62_00735 [Alphaproteobacteria bacterium]
MKLTDLSKGTVDTIARLLCMGNKGLHEGVNVALSQIATIRSLPKPEQEEIRKDLISAIMLIANWEGNLLEMNLEKRRAVFRALPDFIAVEKGRKQVLRAMWDQYSRQEIAI